MLKIKVAASAADKEKAFEIRRKVFVEEQGVSENEEWDGLDEEVVHFIAEWRDKPVGAVRVRFLGQERRIAKIERLAILKRYRGRGFGENIMHHVVEYVCNDNAAETMLHAQSYLVAFYKKLGFELCSEKFIEAGISHVKMTMQLR